MKRHLEPRPGKGFVIALDFGATLGWASLREDGEVAHGAIDLSVFGTNPSQLFLRLRFELGKYLTDVCGPNPKWPVTGSLAYETVQFQGPGTFATQMWPGYWATAITWAETWGIKQFDYPTNVVKKAIIGHGDAPKDAAGLVSMNKKRAARKRPIKPYTGLTVEQAIRALGYETRDHNERDALAVLHTHLATQGRPQ